MPSQTSHCYISIDLKSFFASVECVERGLNPLDAYLVVADESRTDKTICLAVTPALKAHGIGGRARLFEVVERVRKVNYERAMAAPLYRLSGKTTSDRELQSHSEFALDYFVAPPRMAKYIEYSTRIYSIYLRYIAEEDIHVYSIDEVMMDVTPYLATYRMTPRQLATAMIQDVLRETGITATAGIGTNLYLSKVAMDIVAKHIPSDINGVRIAELDEQSYRRQLWGHQPLTDFWRIGRGIQQQLAKYGLQTMGDIANQSIKDENLFYKLFGVNAELLIDHAWGWEPCLMSAIKAYRPQTKSLCSSQVLQSAYDTKKALVVVKEMAEAVALDLLDKQLATDQLVLYIGYDRDSLMPRGQDAWYDGELGTDFYGRKVPKHAHGSASLLRPTCSSRKILEATVALYERIVNSQLLVRRLTLTVNHLQDEGEARRRGEAQPLQLNLFSDVDKQISAHEAEADKQAKERRLMEATLALKKRFGKNALLKGLNFGEGATAIERNAQIGGHKA